MDLSSFLKEFDRERQLPYSNRIIIDSIDSTNSLGKRLLRSDTPPDGSSPWLLIALQQSGGRGRHHHRWSSPLGGIYVSVVLRNVAIGELHALPLLAAVGLCRSLNQVLATRALLKWPNDILVGGKKIGGILVETVIRSPELAQAVVGFGINHDIAPETEKYRSTCVRTEAVEPSSQALLTQMMIDSLTEEIGYRDKPHYAVEKYKNHTMHRPGDKITCRTPEGEISATFLGFEDQGFLRIRGQEGEMILSAGQVLDPFGRSEET